MFTRDAPNFRRNSSYMSKVSGSLRRTEMTPASRRRGRIHSRGRVLNGPDITQHRFRRRRPVALSRRDTPVSDASAG
ncbi:MAG TPA: hypothetical protein VHC00_03085 [Rhizobiaceae bacterium]|nr:hypothetical protein [Rhizobiaceae bacterium]